MTYEKIRGIGCLILLPLLLSSSTNAQLPKFKTETLARFDALFTRYSGWTGADGDYSVRLSDSLTLWLYSDTWVGDVRANRHVDATMINNSVALQYGRNPLSAKVKFFYGPIKDGKPTALITPADGRGFFWLYHGILTKQGLYLFLMQVEKTTDDSFRHIGAWLGQVSNPHDPPSAWRVTQRKIPFGRFSAQGDTLFGSALVQQGGFVYIYGTDEDIENGWHTKHMIVARAPAESFADFDQWRFYTNGQWQADYRQASRITDNLANEYSVSYQPALRKYVLVYTESGLSKNIVLRVATTPYGSWSAPVTVYQCPEVTWQEKIVCYAAKAHPSLSTRPDELVVTYIASSPDFWQMASDARLYRPRFLRLKLSPADGGVINR